MKPTTRMYILRPDKPWGTWARIWITDDGCFTTISDHGSYGYWWTNPGCEFREFLCGCDEYYLARKLRDGRTEFDGEETVKSIRRRILELRRRGDISRESAKKEWWLVCPKPGPHPWNDYDFAHMENEVQAHEWYQQTTLHDAADLIEYRTPIQLQGFLEHLWPRFVEMLRQELAAEAAQSTG